MDYQARGSFNVDLQPQSQDVADGTALGRMSIDKRFHGDLDGTSTGEMLSARMDSGAAVYVAMERVTGTLQGRSGSFVLLHHGAMTRDTQQLTISVVAESGSGELTGLAGTMTIRNVEGRHTYTFDYTLTS